MKSTATYYKASGKIIGCCFLLLWAFCSQAQTRGKIEEIKDPRIDTLMKRRLEVAKPVHNAGSNISAPSTFISLNGFRVQFFSGSNRADAYNAQAKFNHKYPDLRTYIVYQEPNFKVRAGDFRTRMEANKFMEELRPMFTGLFIISEKINPPKLDKNND